MYPKKQLIGPFLTLLSFVVISVALEITLRLYNPFPFAVVTDRVQLPANRTFRYQYEGKERVYRLNSHGMRGPELPADLSEDALTLIALGGSTTECRNIEEGKTWVHLVGEHLKASFPDLWVNNAGFSGHSTYGHTVLFQKYFSEFKPKVVTLLVGINDMCRLDLNSSWELKLGEPDSQVSFWKRSHLIQTAFNIYRLFRVLDYTRYDERFSVLRMQPYALPKDQQSDLLARDSELFIEPYRRRLWQLLELIRSHGGLPILITQPLLYGPAVDPSTGVNLGALKLEGNKAVGTNLDCYDRVLDSGTYWELLELYNAQTRQVANETDTPLIDLAQKLPKDSRYFVDAMHFSEQGAQKIAEIIAPEMRDYLQKRL